MLKITLLFIYTIFNLSVSLAIDENPYLHFRSDYDLNTLSQNQLKQHLANIHFNLTQLGYQKWQWKKSNCQNCDWMIIPSNPNVTNELTMRFINTLIGERNHITQLYKLNNQEYILLAKLAVAILGAESFFYNNQNYLIKEQLTPLRQFIKKLRSLVLNKAYNRPSRGPTQIKIIPKKIKEYYQVQDDQLYIPEFAAVTTIGYLIESLRELKLRIKNNNLHHVTPDNYIENLAYMYIGLTHVVVKNKKPATNNNYVTQVLRYFNWTLVYEKPQL